MASFPPGRKQFNINKNLESGPGVYQSAFYAKTRFSPDLPITVRKPSPELDQIEKLKHLLSEKEQQLQKLKENLDVSSPDISVNPVYPELILTSAYDSRQCVEIYDSHFKYLNQQMREKERKKIEENLRRQKETQERLEQMYYLKDVEAMERRQAAEKAEEYRNSLRMQQSFNKQIELERKTRSVTPRAEFKGVGRNFINAKNILSSPEKIPQLQREQVIPYTKNQNRVTVELSGLQAFQQPVYTKHSPKLQPSYPVVGNRPSPFIGKNDLVATNKFYAAY